MAIIRPALPADVEGIIHVHIASWKTTYRGLIPDEVLDQLSIDRRRDWWQSILAEDSPGVIVAEQEQHIVGFAYFGLEREQDPIYRGELFAIYILLNFQRKGLGRSLLEATRDGLHKMGIQTMLVWVLSKNPARHFYEKLGGIYLRDKQVEIGGTGLQESAYGWLDLRSLRKSE